MQLLQKIHHPLIHKYIIQSISSIIVIPYAQGNRTDYINHFSLNTVNKAIRQGGRFPFEDNSWKEGIV